MSFCDMYFAPPGSGKTTLAVAFAQKALKRGRKVWTNFPCQGAYQIDAAQIGKFWFPGLVIIDEAGIDFNNRAWKTFSNDAMRYVKLHRHHGTDFVFLSQGWDDCDKKIRTVCTRYYYLKKIGPFTAYRLIAKRVGVDDMSKQIIDEYYKVPFWLSGLKFCIRRRWYKYFDSWDAPSLPLPESRAWSQVPADMSSPSPFSLISKLQDYITDMHTIRDAQQHYNKAESAQE